MKRFVEGVSRDQVSFLPECLDDFDDDFIDEDNPARVDPATIPLFFGL